MLTRPRWVLRAEGAVIFVGSVLLYGHGHYHWWVFAVLFLAPDLSMLGYLVNVRLGAMCYNLVHTEVGLVSRGCSDSAISRKLRVVPADCTIER
jgi:Domain of unknown function (DUF4260)